MTLCNTAFPVHSILARSERKSERLHSSPCPLISLFTLFTALQTRSHAPLGCSSLRMSTHSDTEASSAPVSPPTPEPARPEMGRAAAEGAPDDAAEASTYAARLQEALESPTKGAAALSLAVRCGGDTEASDDDDEDEDEDEGAFVYMGKDAPPPLPYEERLREVVGAQEALARPHEGRGDAEEHHLDERRDTVGAVQSLVGQGEATPVRSQDFGRGSRRAQACSRCFDLCRSALRSLPQPRASRAPAPTTSFRRSTSVRVRSGRARRSARPRLSARRSTLPSLACAPSRPSPSRTSPGPDRRARTASSRRQRTIRRWSFPLRLRRARADRRLQRV